MWYDSLTWQPGMFVDGQQAVADFHQLHFGKPGPLEEVIRGPRTEGGDTVAAQATRDGMEDRI